MTMTNQMLIRPATDAELGQHSAEEFWAAFDDSLDRIPRKFRALLLGRAVTCTEEEHDELMAVVRHLPGSREPHPLRVWR